MGSHLEDQLRPGARQRLAREHDQRGPGARRQPGQPQPGDVLDRRVTPPAGPASGGEEVEHDQLEALGLEQPIAAAHGLALRARPHPEQLIEVGRLAVPGKDRLRRRGRIEGIRQIDPGGEHAPGQGLRQQAEGQ